MNNKTLVSLLCLFILTTSITFAQSEKVISIIELQDQRKPVSDFAPFLHDSDKEVVARALNAFGSLQDTHAVSLTLPFLNSPSSAIRKAAAFALGQIGKSAAASALEKAILTEKDRDVFEELCRAFGRSATIEQMEKFPSKLGISFFKTEFQRGYAEVLLRASIRPVSSDSLVRFAWVLTATKDDETIFKSLYALTRFKKSKDFGKNLIFSGRYHDQSSSNLVRMYWAQLLGSSLDTSLTVEKLGQWLKNEKDANVRTNIIRALARFGTMQSVNYILTAINDPIGYVQSAAQSSIMGIKNLTKDRVMSQVALEHVEKRMKTVQDLLSRNDIEWLMVGYKLKPDFKHQLLEKIRTHPNPLLRSNFPFFISFSYNFDQMSELENLIITEPIIVKTTALTAWIDLNRKVLSEESKIKSTLQYAFSTKDMAMITIASDALKDTLFQYSGYEQDLITLLPQLNDQDDMEAIQSILTTMSESDNPVFASSLKKYAGNSFMAIATIAAKGYQQITGEKLTLTNKNENKDKPLDRNNLKKYWNGTTVKIKTSKGDFTLEMKTQDAPYTSLAFLNLFETKFYDKLYFHRVVPNFVVQGGDPRGDGWGGPGYTLRSEFSQLQYSDAGWVGVASAGKDTEGCQFFVVHSPTPHLDGRYTIFAKVISGMDVVQHLEVGDQIFSTEVQ